MVINGKGIIQFKKFGIVRVKDINFDLMTNTSSKYKTQYQNVLSGGITVILLCMYNYDIVHCYAYQIRYTYLVYLQFILAYS